MFEMVTVRKAVDVAGREISVSAVIYVSRMHGISR